MTMTMTMTDERKAALSAPQNYGRVGNPSTALSLFSEAERKAMKAERVDALIRLIEKVRSGCPDDHDFRAAWSYRQYHNMYASRLASESYSGSIDAARALHDAVLPGMPVQITDHSPEWCGGHGWGVRVNWPHMAWKPTFTACGPFSYEAYAETPARAWLLAVLEALIAQEEDQ